MKKTFAILLLISTLNSNSQISDTIKLSNFKLCDLTIDFLKEIDPKIKKISVEEMNLCSDGFVLDGRFENRIGYNSELYPGVIFQKYDVKTNVIAKIHLTKEFKGYLPNGNYIDLKLLKAEEVLKKYDNLNTWTSKGCSEYWGINDNNKVYYYVKIIKDKKPQYPVDEKYYSESFIEGIDIIMDCYSETENRKEKIKPLIILDGKEVDEDFIKNLDPNRVDSINVIKDKNAFEKYGDKGKNGVIEIYLKKDSIEVKE